VHGYIASRRKLLVTTVSVTALLAGVSDLWAADLPLKAPAPVVDATRCAWWGEGGAVQFRNGSNFLGGSGAATGNAKWGSEGALGFDCRFGPSPWHVSAQARYGAERNSGSGTAVGTFFVPTNVFTVPPPRLGPVNIPAATSITHKEDHVVIDFAVGRDIGLGVGATQLKFGLRIAEITDKLSGAGVFNVPTHTGLAPMVQAPFSVQQNSRFAGAGPRVGIDGSIPLGGAWSIDYLAGAAVLFGQSSVDVTGLGAVPPLGANLGVSSAVSIFNLDAQAGLSYWFSPDMKLTASYRFDGYWGALKTISSGGALTNTDRFYNGPMLRFTAYAGGAPVAASALYVPAPTRDQWTIWGEGGVTRTSGGAINFGGPSGTTNLGTPGRGDEGALGFDARLGGTPWHVSADVRYGQGSTSSGAFRRNATLAIPSGTPGVPTGVGSRLVGVTAVGSAHDMEQHALADFSVGRDIGLGLGQSQIKAGLRIAEIFSKTNGSANFAVPNFYSVPGGVFLGAQGAGVNVQQQSRFTGGGPRAALEGSIPIGGGFAIDYLGGVAVLFGARSFDLTTSALGPTFGFANMGVSDNTSVFNLEGQAGLSYWFSSAMKLTASYRFDGYWGALKTLNSAGNITNADRFYSGPMLRLTWTN
jgi:hypothetical protein